MCCLLLEDQVIQVSQNLQANRVLYVTIKRVKSRKHLGVRSLKRYSHQSSLENLDHLAWEDPATFVPTFVEAAPEQHRVIISIHWSRCKTLVRPTQRCPKC